MKKRLFLAVLEGLGIGETPDASDYGDAGANTLKAIYDYGKLNVPFLRNLGLFNLYDIGVGRRSCIVFGAFGQCAPSSRGKDTVEGYLELSGNIVKEELPPVTDIDSTSFRHLSHHKRTFIDLIRANGKDVLTIGRATDFFGERVPGVTDSQSDQRQCLNSIADAIRSSFDGICIAGLPIPRGDSSSGDVAAMCRSLTYFDKRISKFVQLMNPQDMLIITGLHGSNSPSGERCSREYVPFLVLSGSIKRAFRIEDDLSLADVSATALDFFNIENKLDGTSILPVISKK